MSLEIIEYTHKDANSISEIIATIKQRTGLELTSLGSAEHSMVPFNVRFPDMKESQKVKKYFGLHPTIEIVGFRSNFSKKRKRRSHSLRL